MTRDLIAVLVSCRGMSRPHCCPCVLLRYDKGPRCCPRVLLRYDKGPHCCPCVLLRYDKGPHCRSGFHLLSRRLRYDGFDTCLPLLRTRTQPGLPAPPTGRSRHRGGRRRQLIFAIFDFCDFLFLRFLISAILPASVIV